MGNAVVVVYLKASSQHLPTCSEELVSTDYLRADTGTRGPRIWSGTFCNI